MEEKVNQIFDEFKEKIISEIRLLMLSNESLSRNFNNLSFHHEKISLKGLRKRQNMKLKDIAHQLKISTQSLSNYENRNREIPIRMLPQYANILNVSVEQLVYSITQC